MCCKFLEQTYELSTVLYPHRQGSHQLSLGHPPFSSLADFINLDLDISKVKEGVKEPGLGKHVKRSL